MTSSELWISACHAEVKGGGVFADRSSRFLSSSSSFSDNVAGEHGDGIAFESDVPQNLALQLNECAFNYNRADLGGAFNDLRSSILNTHVCRCCPRVYWMRTEKLFSNQCFVHIRRRNWLPSLGKQRRRCRWRRICSRCQHLALLMWQQEDKRSTRAVLEQDPPETRHLPSKSRSVFRLGIKRCPSLRSDSCVLRPVHSGSHREPRESKRRGTLQRLSSRCSQSQKWRSPACQLESPVEEETFPTHEDHQTILGKRPVHESVDDLPLMQIIADLVHSYIQRAIAIPMCMSLSMVCR